MVVRGAKMHQTGCLNAHWLLLMPGGRLGGGERDWAVACAVPVSSRGLTFVYGRQSCDTRAMEAGDVDQGNARFAGQVRARGGKGRAEGTRGDDDDDDVVDQRLSRRLVLSVGVISHWTKTTRQASMVFCSQSKAGAVPMPMPVGRGGAGVLLPS